MKLPSTDFPLMVSFAIPRFLPFGFWISTWMVAPRNFRVAVNPAQAILDRVAEAVAVVLVAGVNERARARPFECHGFVGCRRNRKGGHGLSHPLIMGAIRGNGIF